MTARDMFRLVDVYPPGWGATADYDPQAHGGPRPGNEHCFVHHPGFDIDPAADAGNVYAETRLLRSIEKSAIARGWWGIQYDVIVGQSGTIYGGRGLARSGATSGDVDDDGTHNNLSGEAICVLAGPDTPMTDACRDSLRRLFDAHGGTVIGHKNAGGTITTCPGADRLKFIGDYHAGLIEEPDMPLTDEDLAKIAEVVQIDYDKLADVVFARTWGTPLGKRDYTHAQALDRTYQAVQRLVDDGVDVDVDELAKAIVAEFLGR